MAEPVLRPEGIPDLSQDRQLPRLSPARLDRAVLDQIVRGGGAELVRAATRALQPWIQRPRAPAPQPVTVPLGPAVLVHDPQKATFFVGGVEQWVIDTARFGGTPALTVVVDGGVTRITLAHAFYPGTTLPADLKARIRQENSVWMIRLRLAIGDFDATLPLEAFLNRSQVAASLIAGDLDACPLGAASALGVSGGGAALFTPDWLLVLAGPALLALHGFGDAADLAFVLALPAGAPQVWLDPTLRRTWIQLGAVDELAIEPAIGAPAPHVYRGDATFDLVTLEAGIDAAGVAQRFMLAEATAFPPGAPRFGFEPGGDLRQGDGQPFRAALRNARYGVLYKNDRSEVARVFAGELDETPAWLHAAGISFLVTRPPNQPLAGIIDQPDQAPIVVFGLDRVRTALRVPDVFVTPDDARGPIAFTWGTPPAALPPNAVIMSVDGAAGQTAVRVPPPIGSQVVRRDDFFVGNFQLHNLRFDALGEDRAMAPTDGGVPALRLDLPPQSIGEESFFKEDAEFPRAQTDENATRKATNIPAQPNVPPPPVRALFAQASRLVFTVPSGVAALPVNMGRLLTWTDLNPALASTAQPGSVALQSPDGQKLVLKGIDLSLLEATRAIGPRRSIVTRPSSLNVRPIPSIKVALFPRVPSLPAPLVTAIEAPFRLIISPSSDGGWAHASSPVTRDGRTELWHTRLGVRSGASVSEEPDPRRIIRAIWARDYNLGRKFDTPFLMPLFPGDRTELVDLTANYGNPQQPPVPVAVRRLMLSPLGSWLDLHGRWEPKPPLTIEEWRHRSTLARDHYVRVVYKGFLLPCGHRASLVKITEREFEAVDREIVAYLRQRIYIICREPEKVFKGDHSARQGRCMPFKRVRLTTMVTPNLDQPYKHPNDDFFLPPEPQPNPTLAAFWPRVGDQDFLFHMKVEDWEGRESDFAMPMAFVRQDVAFNPPPSTPNPKVIDAYNKASAARRTASLNGQLVAFAATAADSLGQTTLETQSVTFVVEKFDAASPAVPIHPMLGSAKVDLAALRQLSKSASTADITITPYIDKDFAAGNAGQLFASVTSAPSLDYNAGGGSADKAGGVATPGMTVRGLSRSLGVVGDDSDDFAGGKFDPTKFFAGALNANLLGGITLGSILNTVTGGEFPGKVPRLTTENREDVVRTKLKWTTDSLKTNAPFINPGGANLTLESTVTVNKVTAATDALLSGKLEQFAIELAKVVRVEFKEFRFESVNGKKPDVHVVVSTVTFLPPLDFVNEIADALHLNNFSDPPFLDIGPQGLTVGYGLMLPTVAVGAFSLLNLSLGARLNLPFTGDPMRLRFNLSEREKPFTVSVAPFGGGGFFALSVGMDGVEIIEASIEFGGSVSIDLGVAAGGVYIMAGVYLKLVLAGKGQSELTGYVRAGGSLMVLGLITISMEFYLGLSYSDGKAWGECRISVKVDVTLFSVSVSVSMRKTFAGSAGDPPFRKMMPQPRWAAYCQAFAKEAA